MPLYLIGYTKNLKGEKGRKNMKNMNEKNIHINLIIFDKFVSYMKNKELKENI